MYEYPESLENLIESLRKLPSVGRKSAQRLALHIVSMDRDKLSSFIESFKEAGDKIHKCKNCGNLTEEDICPICRDLNRDDSVICVVEDVTNLLSIEKSGFFKGKYYVLNGLISPGGMISPDDIGVDGFIDRVDRDGVKEVIFAISPTLEGETTMLFLKEVLKNRDIKITRIASGIPVGGNLEYYDDVTLMKALEERRQI